MSDIVKLWRDGRVTKAALIFLVFVWSLCFVVLTGSFKYVGFARVVLTSIILMFAPVLPMSSCQHDNH